MRPMQSRPFARPSAARAQLDALIAENLGFRLGPYLRRIAQASVAAALMAGCGMSHTGGSDAGREMRDAGRTTIVDSGFRADAGVDAGPIGDAGPGIDAWVPPPPPELCAPDGTWRAVQDLAPAMPATYVEAFDFNEFGGPIGNIDSTGTACVDARDVVTCEATLTDLRNTTYQRALLVTLGDSVRRLTTLDEVLAFLGPIDTVNEAALVAWLSGYDFYCAGDFTSTVAITSGGYHVVVYRQGGGCGSPWTTTQYTLRVSPAGVVTVLESIVVRSEEDFGCIGRRPVGLHDLESGALGACESPVGDYFANVARLEESAVAAFDVMIAELSQLGAPQALVDAAARARADEVRHTESMGALAWRFGAAPLEPEIDPAPARTPFDIALENAVEGCIRETFGALVGACQALNAGDPSIAEEMAVVAEDEIRHAELSWALAAWLEPRLTADERARIEAAKREAVEELRLSAARPFHPDVVRVAGMPEPVVAVALVDQLTADIWA